MTSERIGTRVSQLFAGRFQLHEELGRGGMAVVYRATELSSGRVLALKELLLSEHEQQRRQMLVLFEREFHTLAQLSHPRVIKVYDYGVTPDGAAYYTMELLEGGSLRDRAPVPWREACRLAMDVCSCLALLHSRRLLHRDVTPRNVHCTSDGTAKLIDFGAVAPMTSGGDVVVGTPAFTAPEIVQRSATGARTDLYALGGTLYFALTGQLAFAARSFAELQATWNHRPAPPSAHVEGIPYALDDLTLSLLSLEPARRPTSAFAVMQQLSAIAGLPSDEDQSVSRAYLATPSLTGRATLLATLRQRMLRGIDAGGSGTMLWGAAGVGRSRLLDACALEAKTFGARVLRAAVHPVPGDFEVAYALAEHLSDAVSRERLATEVPELFTEHREQPRLRALTDLRGDATALESSLVKLFRSASKEQPLVFAVDDVQRIDEPSAAVLALLLDRFRYGRAVVLLTAELTTEPPSLALGALARRCEPIMLEPLDGNETRELLASVFGDVPNLAAVAEEIFRLACGNPRASMQLAQHLIDTSIISYHAGVWTLPSAIAPQHLPGSIQETIRARIARWSPVARFLAQAQALSFVERLRDEDFRDLAADFGPLATDAAIDALLADRALARDGDSYVLTSELWRATLQSTLDEASRLQAHRALAAIFEADHSLAWIHHTLAADSGEQANRALDALFARARLLDEQGHEFLVEDLSKFASSYPRALEIAQRLGRPARDVHELRHAMMAISVACPDPAYYWAQAPGWLERLVHDSGLDLWRADRETSDPANRLTKALTAAFDRFQREPEATRGYRPDEAIRLLAEHVAISIAIGVRTMDAALLSSLPELLEPFAPLSPLLAALWKNALGSRESNLLCRYELAHERWLQAHTELRSATGAEVRHVKAIRNAIAYALGIVEAIFGLKSAERWTQELDNDPYQRVNALYLRKIVRLEQGDTAGAKKLQGAAEVLALRSRIPQMFNVAFPVELAAHARARDLGGVKEVLQRMKLEAARAPGWIPFVREGEARYELLRGDFVEAKRCFEAVIEATALDQNRRSPCLPIWITAHAGLCEALLGLERAADAHAVALNTLQTCEALQVRAFARDFQRLLGLAEAKLGEYSSAAARLDQLIEYLTGAGVTGLRLGMVFEARAEVALWSGDVSSYERFAHLTAFEYRYGTQSALGARYERLLHEAQRRGIAITPAPKLPPGPMSESDLISVNDLRSVLRDALAASQSESERHSHALRILCNARAARGGHLYRQTAQGLRLVASWELEPPSERLAELVRECVKREETLFETQTMALDSSVSPEAGAPVSQVDGVDYELLPLTCLRDEVTRVAGVGALAPGQEPVVHPHLREMLASLAAELMR